MAYYEYQGKIYDEKGQYKYNSGMSSQGGAPAGTWVTGVSSLDEITKLNQKYTVGVHQ